VFHQFYSVESGWDDWGICDCRFLQANRYLNWVNLEQEEARNLEVLFTFVFAKKKKPTYQWKSTVTKSIIYGCLDRSSALKVCLDSSCWDIGKHGTDCFNLDVKILSISI
jgi:hypothetical protein